MEPIQVVGAIFIAYIVVKEVFVLVKGETKQIARDMAALRAEWLVKGEDNKTPAEQVAELYANYKRVFVNTEKTRNCVEELYKWHNREDDDGVKIWYVRRSLEENMRKLPMSLDKQREVMEALLHMFDKIQTDIESLKKKLPSDIS